MSLMFLKMSACSLEDFWLRLGSHSGLPAAVVRDPGDKAQSGSHAV